MIFRTNEQKSIFDYSELAMRSFAAGVTERKDLWDKKSAIEMLKHLESLALNLVR